MTSMQRETRQTENVKRRKTRGGGELTGRRLAVSKEKLDFSKLAYRWVNEAPARIHAMTKEDDWDVVMNDGVKDENTDLGNAVSQIVGTAPDGSALRAYLCRKPRTFFDEDQADKSAELDRQLTALRRGKSRDGQDGGDYVPNSGIKVG